MSICFFFFFSSRRRHTRYWRDWSSDVCSSDLGALKTPAAVAPLAKAIAEGDVPLRVAAVQALGEIGSPGALQSLERGLDDAERDVRVAAVRALSARNYRPVLA